VTLGAPGATSNRLPDLIECSYGMNESGSQATRHTLQRDAGSTTIIQGDCQPVSAFTWVQQSDVPSLKGKVSVTVMYAALNPGSVANITLELFGSFRVVASSTQ